jgi:hypothetical protein
MKERLRGGSEREQQRRREQAAAELERDRALEQPAQAPPVPALRVAEAELHERLLHREVEQALNERRRRENQGVAAERLRREDVQRDDRRPESERC